MHDDDNFDEQTPPGKPDDPKDPAEEASKRTEAMRASVSDLVTNWSMYVQQQRYLARLMALRVRYLQENGLERAEAIQIVCARGIG